MWRFQPTLPARGATFLSTAQYLYYRNFNPRSPHGERLEVTRGLAMTNVFQPTLPARGATAPSPNFPDENLYFNPRSPHGERRSSADSSKRCFAHFNPRSPHGERLSPEPIPASAPLFQPTLPARGATVIATAFALAPNISTHAPRTGSDGEQYATTSYVL